jgi:hypothetical protein
VSNQCENSWYPSGPTQQSRCGLAMRLDVRISRSATERKRTMVQQELRQYELQARSTETFGRVLCSARTHHFVVDGPIQNGCPGEAITVLATWIIRSKKEGLGQHDHSFPLARNSMEGQWEPVLLAG